MKKFVLNERTGTYSVRKVLSEDDILLQAKEISLSKVAKGASIGSSSELAGHLRGIVQGYDYEVFGVIYFDNQHTIIETEELFRGTIDSASVYPREVVKNALLKGAKAISLFHNHPSGKVSPSEADRAITRRLVSALAIIDVKILDHFIITADDHYSFAEKGEL